MQHYGAPTRLLDWTCSPYIAAFFGIEHAVKQDFCVWGLYVDNVMTHTKKMLGEKHIRDYDFLRKDEHPPFVALFNSRLRSQRLISQQGVFTAQGVLKATVEQLLEDYPEQPKKDKGKGFVKFVFRNTGTAFGDYVSFLHRMNISDASLYPGIEGFSRSLRLGLMNIGSKF